MGLKEDRNYNLKNESKFSRAKDTINDYFSETSKLDISEENRKKLFLKLTLILVCMYALEVLSGIIRFDGIIHNTFIIIVYVLEILMIFSLTNGLFTLSVHYKKMIDKEIRKSVEAFPTYTIILIVFCVVSIIASIVYVIVNGFHDDKLYFFLYLLFKIAIGVLSYYFRILTIDLKFVDNDEE